LHPVLETSTISKAAKGKAMTLTLRRGLYSFIWLLRQSKASRTVFRVCPRFFMHRMKVLIELSKIVKMIYMKTTENYRMQLHSDGELIKTILAGDIESLYYLVIIKYREELYAVIGKHLVKSSNKCTDINMEYWLYKFYNYLTVPTKIKKKSKFENIKNKYRVRHWLCQCCRYFLINDEEFKIFTVHDFDFSRLSMSENLIYQSENSQSIIEKFVLIIETFNKILTAREKYIVFTYLYCEKKQPDVLPCLNKKIAISLNTTEGNIRKIKSVAYDKVRKFLNK
jgi:hypothetical protein